MIYQIFVDVGVQIDIPPKENSLWGIFNHPSNRVHFVIECSSVFHPFFNEKS